MTPNPGPTATSRASRLATRPTALPATPTTAAKRSGFIRRHKLVSALILLLLLGTAVGIAAVVWSQAMTATPTTRTSPIIFATGDDAASLDALDFLGTGEPVISASGAAASFTPYGIPGATALSLGEVVELQNADTADNQDYLVTLSVSGTPAATLTAFTITFLDDVAGTPTLRTWDLLGTPTFTQYTLSDGEIWEFTVASLVMTAAASGSQGTLTISASITT